MLALFKLSIIGSDEILAIPKPHDDLWYIQSASWAYWFPEKYSQMVFIHLPSFPLFIFFTHLTGISLRIIIEVLFLFSGFYLSYSLIKAGLNKLLSLLTFVLIIFQPVSFSLFNHTLSETFYAPILLLSIASFIQLLVNRNEKSALKHSIIVGLLLSILWFTRSESILIIILLVFILIITLFISKIEKLTKEKTFNLVKKMFLLPSGIVFLLYILVCSANYASFGLFAPSELDSSGYRSAYNSLQKIKPPEAIRFVPISTETRELAYKVSPSFRKLKPFLENPSNWAFFWTKKETGIENEMGAGWFYWILRDAVYEAGYKDSLSADSFYKKISLEINNALDDKEIEKRSVFIEMVDPYFYRYLVDFPSSFLKIGKLFFNTEKPSLEGDSVEMPRKLIKLVDQMTNRRFNPKIQTNNGNIQGWAFLNQDKIVNIKILTSEKKAVSSIEIFDSRPDVAVYYKKIDPTVTTPINTGFTLTFNTDKSEKNDYSIEFVSEKRSYIIPLQKIKVGNIIEINDTPTNDTLRFILERKLLPENTKNDSFEKNTQYFVWSIYGNILLFMSILSVFILLYCAFNYKKLQVSTINIAFLLIIFIILTRMMLFSLVDISSWDGAQTRYIFPIMPLFGASLVLIINQGILVANAAKHPKNTSNYQG